MTHRDRIQTVPAVLRAFAEGLGKDDQVALESTGVTWAVAEVLAEHAGRVVVSNPMRTKAIASAKVKTDKVDARVLVELLAADYLPEVWVPDGATRNLLRQISHRRSLVQERTRIRNRVHSVLHRNLVQSPCSDLFGKAGMAWLRDLQLASEERREDDSALRLLGFVDAEIDATEAEIATAVVDDRRVRHLLTIPGVGLMTAVALVAVVGDVHRLLRPSWWATPDSILGSVSRVTARPYRHLARRDLFSDDRRNFALEWRKRSGGFGIPTGTSLRPPCREFANRDLLPAGPSSGSYSPNGTESVQ